MDVRGRQTLDERPLGGPLTGQLSTLSLQAIKEVVLMTGSCEARLNSVMARVAESRSSESLCVHALSPLELLPHAVEELGPIEVTRLLDAAFAAPPLGDPIDSVHLVGEAESEAARHKDSQLALRLAARLMESMLDAVDSPSPD